MIMKKLIGYFECVPMTVISGIFLVVSFIFSDTFSLFNSAWITVIISGTPIVFSAYRKLIKNRGISRISSALLISIAMVAAIAIGDLFAAGEVAFIMAIGEILEDKTIERAKKGLKKLISLTPVKARILCGDDERIVLAKEIKVGDVLRVLPGETIPVDGKIISGETSVDQSVITGESIPVDKVTGDSIFCGTINMYGSVDVRAEKVGADSSLSKLVKMVQEAENKKAPMQRTADKWASILVPVALLIAVITYLITKDITRAVTVLVVFCPCALVLATPTAVMAAIGQATKQGIIIKSGEILEKMGKVNTIAFDKTGTITHGRLSVCDIEAKEGYTREQILGLAVSAELKSEHPLAKAIISYARSKNVELSEPDSFLMEPGRGVCITHGNDKIMCGNERYITDTDNELKPIIEDLHSEGKAVVLVSKNDEFIGIIALSDTIKQESVETVRKLSEMGINSVLLTGDSKSAANYIGKRVGIDGIYAELLPEEKVGIINKLQSENKVLCMIGDGVNDAPALKIADVGVAMGGMGSDIAVEASDIALIANDLSKIPYLKRLSDEAVKTIKFSITLSLLINFVAIILSFFGILTPTTGALVHNAGSCVVITIAAMLYERKID